MKTRLLLTVLAGFCVGLPGREGHAQTTVVASPAEVAWESTTTNTWAGLDHGIVLLQPDESSWPFGGTSAEEPSGATVDVGRSERDSDVQFLNATDAEPPADGIDITTAAHAPDDYDATTVDASAVAGGCDVACQSGDLLEGEPTCANGYVDSYNGGCNSAPNVFGRIECGQTICGTYGTFLSPQGSNFRDTDWYQFTLPQATNVTWTAVGEARTRVFIMRGPCPAASLGTGVADACQAATVTINNLAAGTYYAFVGTDAFTGVACGSSYRATLTVTPCCVEPPQPGDLIEGEPLCANGTIDNFNGGCNSDPDVFGHIECGQTVAGTYGTFISPQGSNFRDTDWYEFTLPQAANVTWTAVGEARTRVFIMRAPCPAASLGTGVADPCLPATVSLTNLAPGTYSAFVGTDVFTGVPCGSRYRASLTIDPCCPVSRQPEDALEGEPLCANGYVDAYDGGCNSTPPIFNSIRCGQSVAGTYGTFLSPLNANFRDTDWYHFTLLQPTAVTWTAIGEARTRVFIMQGTCPTGSLGTSVADACLPATVTVNLDPGTYSAFVGTDLFTGVECGSRYRATLTTDPCVNRGDLDDDGDVDLRDFVFFADCLRGPNVAFPPGCQGSDLDGDGDVDLHDLSEFYALFTGQAP